MMRLLWAAVLTCLALEAAAIDQRENPVGKLHVFEPSGPMRGFVLLYSGAHGWDEHAQRAATALGRAGALVAGIDLQEYRRHNVEHARKCFYLVGDAEAVARDLQRARNIPDYHAPILAGVGDGGALAYAVLREAPPAALAGAVSIEPTVPEHPGCIPADVAHPQRAALPGFWTVGTHGGNALIDRVRAQNVPADARRIAPNVSSFDAVALLVSAHLAAPLPAEGTARLPLIELPSAQPTPLLAILFSGDGGWRDLDKTIAEELARNSVAAVGWDCLRYFWSRKTPEQAAHDLAFVIDTYSTRWHAEKVALIGYSFGADVLPLLYDRLPPTSKNLVAQLSLLGLSSAADFEIKVSGWLGGSHGGAAVPTQPALATIDPQLIQCFYGHDEQDSVCPQLASRHAEVIETQGGHHFDGDYVALARRIADGFRSRAKAGR
jgi:type IV secretory pathway VirJ component